MAKNTAEWACACSKVSQCRAVGSALKKAGHCRVEQAPWPRLQELRQRDKRFPVRACS